MIIGNPRPAHPRVPRAYRASTTRRKMVAGALLASFVLVMGVTLAGLLMQGNEEARLSPATARKVATSAAKSAPPLVEPVELVQIDEEDARRINAAIPFVTGPITPAKSFILGDDSENHDRARDCMASALYYEAGDDAPGQSAVAQVIVNRLRHPAFPKTVCGVVYQGAERHTGCQFTFTCDGAMQARSPSPAQWVRAQAVAQLALNGGINRTVGTATHYHTDWVVPTWSSSLDKIARIGTHLFFRWRGGWGLPPAFRGRPDANEPMIAQLATLSPLHRPMKLPFDPLPLDETPPKDVNLLAARGAGFPAEAARGQTDLKGNRLIRSEGSTYMLALASAGQPGSYALAALALCRGRESCTVMGWLGDAGLPASGMPDAAARARMSFRYARTAGGAESVQWNCAQVSRPDPAQCF